MTESKKISDIWNQFLKTLKCFNSLNVKDGCTECDINYLETELNILMPEDLKNMYLISNGQKYNGAGIFKAIFGFDVYKRLYFRSISDIIKKHKTLLNHKELVEYGIFNKNLIPFAWNDFSNYIYCIDIFTNEIFLLQIDAPDWTLPFDWQVSKVKRGDNLESFIKYQILLY
jgi:hypothetical protein